MDTFLRAVVQGVPIGGVFALIAIGFVLTYKTSGVFNLAFGAQAFTSAAVYYKLYVVKHWAMFPAVVVAVFVVAPLLGLLLERLIFRHLRGATPVARLVVTIGLLVLIPALVKIAINFPASSFGAVAIVPNGKVVYHLFGRYEITREEISQIAVALLSALGLAALFRFTTLGLRMRAVVESARMTELAGIRADRVTAFSWALSSTFAGLAGVLIAPKYTTVDENNFFTLVVAGIAAAAIGGLVNLPRALAGGVGLGVAATLLATYLPSDSILGQQIRPALPFFVLFGVVLFWRNQRVVTDPLATVDPPPPSSAADNRKPFLVWGTRGFWTVVLALLGMHAFVWGNAFRTSLYVTVAVYAVIFMAITVFTGLAGEICLCVSAFAAIGAYTTMQLAHRYEVSVLGGAVAGALVAAAVGALLALPLIRLSGIWLALATLAFALLFQNVLVGYSWVGGISPAPKIPRPIMGSIDFESDKSFLILCIVVIVALAWLIRRIRNGTTGLFLASVRGSEVAAVSIGISQAKLRITAFALSAGIAGLGGGLLAMRSGYISYESDFGPFIGLFWLVLVVNLSTRTTEGAIQAAAGFILFPEYVLKPLTEHVFAPLGIEGPWQYIFFGLGALTFARHPEGILEFQQRRSLNAIQEWLDRRSGARDNSKHGDAATFDQSAATP